MPKINGETPILLLNSEPMKDGNDGMKTFTVGKAIAAILSSSAQAMQKFGSFKAYVLALDFYTKSEVELDNADIEKLTDLMEHDETFAALVAGQVVLALKKAKEQEAVKSGETPSLA